MFGCVSVGAGATDRTDLLPPCVQPTYICFVQRCNVFILYFSLVAAASESAKPSKPNVVVLNRLQFPWHVPPARLAESKVNIQLRTRVRMHGRTGAVAASVTALPNARCACRAHVYCVQLHGPRSPVTHATMLITLADQSVRAISSDSCACARS